MVKAYTPIDRWRKKLIEQTLYLGIYVDDILCIGSDPFMIECFNYSLSNILTLTFNVTLNSFPVMQINHDQSNKLITLSQPGNIDYLLNKFKISYFSS